MGKVYIDDWNVSKSDSALPLDFSFIILFFIAVSENVYFSLATSSW